MSSDLGDRDSKPSELVEDRLEDVQMDVKQRGGGREMAWRFLKENALILLTLLGIGVGFAVGVGLQQVKPSPDVLQWIGVPGEIFLRSLKATIFPIIVCMVITATSSVDPTKNRSIAVVAVLAFFLTALLAVLTAVVLFFLFKPASNTLQVDSDKTFGTKLETQDIFLDLIRNIFPDNVVDAAISQTVTEYTEEEPGSVNASSNDTDATTFKKSLTQSRGINILGLITICAVVGAAANTALPPESAFLSFFRHGQQVVMKVMVWITWTTPVGVASLVAQSIAGVSNLGSIFLSLSRLVLCVVVGLTFHQLITLPVIYFVLWRKNPFTFLMRCAKAFFVSFAATATSVALPHMLDACKQNGVSSKVSRFVIPMSVTLHADGSALYIASASMFVAHTSGAASIGVSDFLVIGTLSSVLSLTIPPVPSASIVTVAVILTSINRPLQGIALLFTVEWLLDRLRSGVNATSHVICAAYTDAICNGRVRQVPEPETTRLQDNTNSWCMEVLVEGEAVAEPNSHRTSDQELIHIGDVENR
ncbi:hypothetical protein RRG08_022167 [Elysia crispata]|uniref:Amino acid transporter n=1 Tax=Elysia crispata TaxID=231223 RepID=A0AAE1DYP8_9GAST|nr:hypothetical protein RRG08_022167 [Elysia crispata]